MVRRSTVLRLRRWLPFLFVVSLAGNLFFAGLWLAGSRPANGHEERPDPVSVLQSVASTLPPSDGEILRKAIDGKNEILATERDRRRVFRDRFVALLQAPTFDAAAAARLLDENEAAATDYRRRIVQGLLEAATSLSLEARQQLAQLEIERDKRGHR